MVNYKTIVKEALAIRDGLFCGICKRAIMESKIMTIDHIVPLSLGGKNNYANFQLAHDACNRKKGNGVKASNLDKLKK